MRKWVECKLSDNDARIRVYVTLTKGLVETIDRLVKRGLYMDQRAVIRDAIRHLFHYHGIEPLYDELVEPGKTST